MAEIESNHLGVAITQLGFAHDRCEKGKLAKMTKEIKTLHDQMQQTLIPLKTSLSSLKATQIDGPYDISKHAKTLNEFRSLYQNLQEQLDSKEDALDFLPQEEILPEDLKAVSKEHFLRITGSVEEIETDYKHQAQDMGQKLNLEMQNNIVKFSALNNTLQSFLSFCQRAAQNSRPH